MIKRQVDKNQMTNCLENFKNEVYKKSKNLKDERKNQVVKKRF